MYIFHVHNGKAVNPNQLNKIFFWDIFYIGKFGPDLRSYYVPSENKIFILNSEEVFKIGIKSKFKGKKVLNSQFSKNKIEKYYKKLSTKSEVATIFVTNKCNLQCNYCYAYNKDKISHQNIDDAKLFLKCCYNKYNLIKIRFQGGGEPTLFPDFLKEMVSFSVREFDIKNFEIQSNFLFSKSVRNLLIENFNDIYASVDGPYFVQNLHRGLDKNSNVLVEKNLKLISSSNLNLSVKCTVSNFSNDLLIEIVDYFASLGIKKIIFEPIFLMGKAKYNKILKPPTIQCFLNNFKKAKLYALERNIFAYSCFLPVERTSLYYYCGGVSCSPSLTLDGFISSCDEHLYSKPKDPFIIGKLNKRKRDLSFYKNKINFLRRRNIFGLEYCDECFLKFSCQGGCPSRVLDRTNDMFKPLESLCNIIKFHSLEYLLKLSKKYYLKQKESQINGNFRK